MESVRRIASRAPVSVSLPSAARNIAADLGLAARRSISPRGASPPSADKLPIHLQHSARAVVHGDIDKSACLTLGMTLPVSAS